MFQPMTLPLQRIPWILLALIGGCTPTGQFPAAGVPVTGDWGGEHIRMTLNEAGGVVEYDCARGGLTQPLLPNSDGRFDTQGVFIPQHGGPVRMDEKPDSIPARYVGRISGRSMSVEVRTTERTIGTFVLAKGEIARVFKCL